MDLMITYIYMTVVPFNNNTIFKKQLNSISVLIGLHKTMAHYCLECTKTDQPVVYQVIAYSISVKLRL